MHVVEKFDVNDMISSDTYNESEILKTFQSHKKNDQILLFKAACNIAIIGAGGKSLGKIRNIDGNIVEITDLFQRLNVRKFEGVNSKFEPGDLSIRRLTRLFRKQISDVINKTGRNSYLWSKYSDKDQKYAHICFAGGEHLVEKSDEAIYLIKTYRRLDEAQNTKFLDRLRRVFIARNIANPKDIDTWITTEKF